MSISVQDDRIVSLAPVLLQVSAELQSLASVIFVVEETVNKLAGASVSSDVRFFHELQSIDMIAQSLLALAGFNQILANQMPDSWQVDISGAAGSISLAAMAKRLHGASGHPAHDHHFSAGELDLLY